MSGRDDYRILTAGDTAVVVEFGEAIDRAVSARVHALDRALASEPIAGIRECIPTFRSLMIHYEPLEIGYDALVAGLAEAMDRGGSAEEAGQHWTLPVCYEGDMAPDLAAVAERIGLGVTEVIDRHVATPFHIYMLGFLPGQAYMGDNPAELVLPRRETPRLSIPAGSLAIAMGMTSIFPAITPCGWHLIGRCPVPMWDLARSDEPLLRADDAVTFRPIGAADFARLEMALAAWSGDLTPQGLRDLLP